MKSFLNIAFLVAVAIGITGFGASAVEPGPVLSKKEVKALIPTAKTREDHMKLARYYHYEANTLEAAAKDHDEMSTEYFRVPGSRPTLKYPTMGAHCRDLSAYYRQAAKKAEEMAAMHEEMAKDAGK
jgi:hypothetical protein